MNPYLLIRKALFKLQPETAHEITTTLGCIAAKIPCLHHCLAGLYSHRSEKLEQRLFNRNFANPIGLSAGFDKKGTLVDLIEMLGFGFTEIGSLSASCASGNPKPRVFRLVEDESIINRMGLNNPGIIEGLANLRFQRLNIPYGINLVKTHDPSILGEKGIRDVLTSYKQACSRGTYITLNISCPNTTEGKTFEDPKSLEELLKVIYTHKNETTNAVPLLLKFSSDSSIEELKQSVEIATKYGVDGFILCNTTISRDGLQTSPSKLKEIGAGGLSGPLLTEKVIERIKCVYQLTNGEKPIIGVGGINSAQTAYKFIRAGASLLQLYTALVFHGPFLPSAINKGLTELLEKDSFNNISEAIGADAK